MGQYVWPVDNTAMIIAYFGYRSCITHGTELHLGVDIDVNEEKVVAAHPGKITRAGEYKNYGKCIDITYGDIVTRYAHLSKINVEKDNYVNAGDEIAVSGNTGDSTTPHLHFEFYYKGIVKDPLLYLSQDDTLSNYTGTSGQKYGEETLFLPQNELSWSEMSLLSSQAVEQVRMDWKELIKLKQEAQKLSDSNIQEKFINISEQAILNIISNSITDLSLDEVIKNYQKMRQILQEYDCSGVILYDTLFAMIEERILALSIKQESISKQINIYETSIYKGLVTTAYNDSELLNLQLQKNEIENQLSEASTLYINQLNQINHNISNYNRNIIEYQNKINKITDKYSIIQAQITECVQKYNDVLQRIDNYDSNFSDDFAYWNKSVVESPETLNFWLEFLDTKGELNQYSIPKVGDRSKVDNANNVTSIYFREIPQIIFYGYENDNTIVNEKTGYTYINISDWAKDLFTYSAQGISAKDYIDSQLYNYSYCIEEISLTTIPIYYLEPNTRIFIYDKKSHIEGEYLIKTLSIPLQYNGLMSISATKAPISLY